MEKIVESITKTIARFFIYLTSKGYRVLLAYIGSVLLAIVTFTLVEHWTVMDAYWWSQVASLTIGYGDFAPKTTLGRFLATPFHYFWVFYCAPAIVGHVVFAVFKNKNELTNAEQEWLFKVVTIMFNWNRWLVQVQVNNPNGRVLPLVPHTDDQGQLVTCPTQAPDTDEGDVGSEAA